MPLVTLQTARRAVLLAGLVPSSGYAQQAVSADIAATGDAGIAHTRDNSLIRINPAGIGLEDQFDVQLGFSGGFDREWMWTASAVDGRTSDVIQFGLAYTGSIRFPAFDPVSLPGWGGSQEELTNRLEQHDITAAIAVPLLNRRLSLGLNGTLSVFNQTYRPRLVSGNMDAGISARPADALSIGFVARNLIPVGEDFLFPSSVGLGFRVGPADRITAAFETEYRYRGSTRRPWVTRAGLETILAERVIVRGGWNWDGDRADHRATAGLAVYAKDVGTLSYAIQIPVIPHLRGLEVGHFLTLTLFTSAGMDGDLAPMRWDDRR